MTAVLVTAALLVPGPVVDGPYASRCHDLPVCPVIPPWPPPDSPQEPATSVAPPPPSTPASSPAQPLPGSGVERWRDLVAAYFPASEVDTALAVMACESGGDPNAYNPSGASGLMQVLASWADNFGVLPDQLFDPETNIWIASELWADGGWTHWACA